MYFVFNNCFDLDVAFFLVDSSAVTMDPVVVQKVFRLRLHLHRRNVVHRVYFALFAQITILIQILHGSVDSSNVTVTPDVVLKAAVRCTCYCLFVPKDNSDLDTRAQRILPV